MQTIGETAALAGVSIQTLRHYDQLGLLKPQARSTAGYRLYGREELLRLREILVWRQLGFPLADVAALVDDPHHDRAEALRRQRELLSEQHDRFGAMLRGVDSAIAAIEAGHSLADKDIFHGFDVSLSTDDLDGETVTARLRLVDGPARLGRKPDSWRPTPRPRRIVATEPIRIGENLLALGILPVGVGTFFDETTNVRFCPWPELVEAPIRECVRDIGWYGSNKQLIADAQPDLILDLRFPETGETVAESASDGGCSYDDLCEIAPVMLLDAPIGPPAFVRRIEELAAALQVEDRAQPLLASWHARILALREHVAGKTASALNLSPGPPRIDPIGLAPRVFHEAQLFGVLGLELASPAEGEPSHWGSAIKVTPENVGELSAPTLFLTVDGQAAFGGPVHRLVSHGPLAALPAVRSGRVFESRWMHMRSGWFTAHWQLDVIARAFGVTRLRTAESEAPVHMALTPEGKAAAVSTVGCGRATLRGPGISELNFDLEAEGAACVDVGDVAGDVCAFPQAYSLETEQSGSRRLTLDRESALERLARGRLAA